MLNVLRIDIVVVGMSASQCTTPPTSCLMQHQGVLQDMRSSLASTHTAAAATRAHLPNATHGAGMAFYMLTSLPFTLSAWRGAVREAHCRVHSLQPCRFGVGQSGC
jgi:hypothetical protein